MTLLEKAKANLLISHYEDDKYIEELLTAATRYAEKYQHFEDGYYDENAMPATTEQAVIMLTSFLYESRDGSTGGFFGDNVQAPTSAFTTINNLLRLDREWFV